LLPSLVARAGDDRPIDFTEGFQRRDFAYVDDVADALVRLLASPRKAVAAGEGPFDAGVVNVATGVSVTVREFVRAAAREFLIDEGRLRFGALPARADDTEHPPTPVARLAAALGAPLDADLALGLRRTHRRLLASLYEKPPAAEERKTEPAGGRPPAPKAALRRREDRPRPASSAGKDGAPPGAR
jgi:nucleoside-diphosphate-sugar epimerase